MLKIFQARLQQYMNQGHPDVHSDVQAEFRKCRGTRDQIANIHWIIQKARKFQKNIYFYFIDCTKGFDCVNHNKLWKIRNRRWEYQATLPVSWETCMWVKKQQLELNMEQWTSSKLGKEYIQAVYSHPVYLINTLFIYSVSMQSTLWEMPG